MSKFPGNSLLSLDTFKAYTSLFNDKCTTISTNARNYKLMNEHEKRSKSEEPVQKRCRKSNSPPNPEHEYQLDVMNKTSTVLQEIVQEDKKGKKKLIHKFSFL